MPIKDTNELSKYIDIECPIGKPTAIVINVYSYPKTSYDLKPGDIGHIDGYANHNAACVRTSDDFIFYNDLNDTKVICNQTLFLEIKKIVVDHWNIWLEKNPSFKNLKYSSVTNSDYHLLNSA